MATYDQLFKAYYNKDPNVSQMTIDPFGWNIEQTFADQDDGDGGGGGGGSSVNTGDGYLPGTNPDPNTVRMPKQYIDYLDKNRHTGKNNLIEKGIGFLKNTSIGQGVGAAYGILQDIMPMNQTAIMNNEMLGQGFAVDNIGRIVRVDQGDPDTAGNIMAGYNVSKMDEETFEDRLNSLGNMSVEGRKKRRKAIEAAREAWRRAKIKTGNVYHAKYKDRPDYRMLDTKAEEYIDDVKEVDQSEEFDDTPSKDVDQPQEFDNTPSSDNVGYNEPGPGADHGEFGPASWMIADGGMVKDAPRRPYGKGGIVDLL